MDQEYGAEADTTPEPSVRDDELRQLREENLALRNRALAHPSVSAAQGIIKERYRLAALQPAFELLRGTSQRYNIRLHTLADAVIRIPGPAHRSPVWFPGRARTSAPALTSITPPRHGDGEVTQGAVLGAALRQVLDITGTDMGNVQLAEGQLLRLDKHQGLDRPFTDYFAFVDHTTTSCAEAAQTRSQVTVRDVATAPVFDEESRRVILQAGSRACHSVPLLDEHGILRGVISSHHSKPLTGLTRIQLEALQTTSATVGRWLSWHRRTVLLDALEHLHSAARQTA
ncbi:GAF and ANTAR domain-containing protein [Streptomyces sp. CAU 1734]|uniref:GAF and ANTAR domain-containing protein n=1 Tax=Streptomyces sp. CAU 1734 TaxID=3140360 RepID=UPI00326002D0